MSLPPDTPTDEELWLDAAAGSADAWGEIFLRHNRAIYNYCFRRTGQWSAAEDLTSAVFLEGWRRRMDVRPHAGSALPWLYGIATMLTHNHRRALRRYRNALDRVPLPEQEHDPADDVAARLDAQRQLARIRAELPRLRQRDRDLLELAAEQRLSHTEIAVALAIPVGTVKSRLTRIRNRLDLAMEDSTTPSQPFKPGISDGGRHAI